MNTFMGAAFERCPSGLVVVDSRGRIVVVNSEIERMLGYSRDELLGQPVEMLVPGSLAARHVGHRTDFHQHPEARRMGAGREVFARHRSGHEVPVEIGLSAVETTEDVFVLCTVVDVTERRCIEEQLRQTQKLEVVGNLASGIAHDFNNILLGIIGYTELARESIQGNDSALEDLDVVLDSAKRGRSLVNRLLAFTRPSKPDRSLTNLHEPLRNTLRLIRATLPSGIEIRHSFDVATPSVVADPMELHQIIMNLATNAAQAMKGGGVLEIHAAPISVDRAMVASNAELQLGLCARLSVSDTGSGIPAKALSRIFDPFYTTKPTGEGTGLGLSVIARIVRSLGGCIIVKSTVGTGSCFEVFLPAATSAASPNEVEPMDDSRRPCILHIEDEEPLARLGKRILERANFTVISHTSSPQGLAAFRADPQRFDLVITDNNMPHMTGRELAVKLIEIRPDVPILMVSGIGDGMSFEELQTLGIRRLLAKPYLASELRAAALDMTKPASSVLATS